MTKQSKSWREMIPVHPAADLFPLMCADELTALADDIKRSGLTSPIAITTRRMAGGDWKYWLLDGRNRLNAMERAGIEFVLVLEEGKCKFEMELDHQWSAGWFPEATVIKDDADVYAYVISANIHRRHLAPEQKRSLIAQILKARPGRSNRTIAKQVAADHKTVAAVRDNLEARGEIPHVSTVEDTKGRKQPARKSPSKKRRDVEDYIAEKNARMAAAKDADVPELALQQTDIENCAAQPQGISPPVQRILEAIDELDDQQREELRAALMPQWSVGPDVPARMPDLTDITDAVSGARRSS